MNRENVVRQLLKIAKQLIARKEIKWLWHISNHKFRKFDMSKTVGGAVWFAKDKDDLVKNMHGASISSRKPIWLYKCSVITNKIAGWKEYDKYVQDQLDQMGYDAIDLDDDFVALNVNNIRIHEVTRVNYSG